VPAKPGAVKEAGAEPSGGNTTARRCRGVSERRRMMGVSAHRQVRAVLFVRADRYQRHDSPGRQRRRSVSCRRRQLLPFVARGSPEPQVAFGLHDRHVCGEPSHSVRLHTTNDSNISSPNTDRTSGIGLECIDGLAQ